MQIEFEFLYACHATYFRVLSVGERAATGLEDVFALLSKGEKEALGNARTPNKMRERILGHALNRADAGARHRGVQFWNGRGVSGPAMPEALRRELV